MVAWSGDGDVTAYNATSAALLPAQAHLVSPQTVKDAQLITRLQYNVPLVAGAIVDQIKASVTLTYAGTGSVEKNFSALGASQYGATMWIVPSSDFSPGHTPTAEEIIAAPNRSKFSSTATYSVAPGAQIPAGSKTFTMVGPRGADLSPGVKYWLLVVPTWVVYAQDIVINGVNHVFYADDQPMATAHGLNTPPTGLNARGVSFWTNRSPTKPVITSPATGSIATAGANVTLAWTQPDADAVAGTVDTAHTDIAGAAIQYRAKPSASNPSPAWQYLRILESGGFHSNSWYIKGTGMRDVGTPALLAGTLDITAGVAEAAAIGKAYLPSGDWQIRVQTYDQGNPYPNTTNPISVATAPPGTNTGYRPETFPAFNVSPWSDSINISIPTQVPPPVPVSPKQAAIIVGSPVTLIWQYKNTALPPNVQKTRTIQMREVGAAAWTTVLNADVSASPSWLVTGFALEVGKQYEWQVMVTDSTNFASQFSQSARFYVIPAPASGSTRPLPDNIIDGATLGCGTHRAFIYRRGGLVRVGEIKGLTHVDWARVRDDISTAKIVVSDWDIDCGNLLAQLQCWAYELVIFRNNGFTEDRVWEGPITLLTYTETDVTVEAKDVMGYAYRRIIRDAFSDSANGDTVVNRATRILQAVLAPDNPNLLSYLTPLNRDDDAREYRSTPAYSRTAFEEIDDMAANAGLDYTTIGRAIVLWGTKHRIGTLPEFKDKDLGAAPIISEYGMSMANRYAVGDGTGIYGEATRLDVSGNDPIYGLVEMLSSSWASDSPGDSGTYTQAGLQTIIQSFTDFAETSIADRYPPPVVVRVPDNTSLSPDVLVSIQQLVPGVVIPLRSNSTLRHVVGDQKLDSVKVVDDGANEVISITMSPFNRDDVNPDAGAVA